MWSGVVRSDDTGGGEHCDFSDNKEQSEDDIWVDIRDNGQHHREDESTGDINFQHSGSYILRLSIVDTLVLQDILNIFNL